MWKTGWISRFLYNITYYVIITSVPFVCDKSEIVVDLSLRSSGIIHQSVEPPFFHTSLTVHNESDGHLRQLYPRASFRQISQASTGHEQIASRHRLFKVSVFFLLFFINPILTNILDSCCYLIYFIISEPELKLYRNVPEIELTFI